MTSTWTRQLSGGRVRAARLGASPDLTHLEAEPWVSAIKAIRP